jgi:hypothetical protein
MSDNKQKRKAAYIEAVKKYEVSMDVLKKIHCRTEDTVDKWLHMDNRYPPFEALYELHHFLKRFKLPSPDALNRIVKRPVARINEYVMNLGESPIAGGEISRDARANRTEKSLYTYKGEPILLKDIRIKLGLDITKQTIRIKIKNAGVEPGGAIDNVDFTRKSRNGMQAKIYYYKGNKVTIDDLHAKAHININRVCDLLRDFREEDDVTQVIDDEVLRTAHEILENMK